MARYQVVAHQTATSPSLMARVMHIAATDPTATFTLLIPATHPMHLIKREGALFTWDEGEAERIARARAEEARARFEQAGLRVEGTVVGDASPILAIKDELWKSEHEYEAIVLSTLPPGKSRWIAMDVHREAEQLSVPVIHVYDGMTEASTQALLRQRPVTERISHAWSAPRWLRRIQPSVPALMGIMALYLVLAAGLAIGVHRGFLLNDAIALLVFAALIGGLYALERRPRAGRGHRHGGWALWG